MGQEQNQGSSKLVWIILAVVIVLGGLAAWYFLMGPGKTESTTVTQSTTKTTKTTSVKEPIDGWKAYTSEKFKFTINHPETYTAEKTADGSVKFTKGGKTIVDIYSSVGGTSADSDATVKLYTDATKGYMTNGVARSVTVAGTSGQQITGTLGKNAGIARDSDGVKGSVVVFTKNDRTFVMDSYDAGDEATAADFTQMLSEISFQ